ncbi:MAG: cytochrome b/b6 domain-containing protein [Candidatus Thiodiazotropha sp. (ex Cardiolucina cf. quadrata)]|nr:cytochrome b/b6 domain-containing protein [Candidatus Thiodiazotropha sp. (ex Cardiolucina cf. quadrata)]
MQATSVTRILVWSRGLRLAHWSLALSSIGLLITGWLMNNTGVIATTTTEIHYMLSALLLPTLLFRLYLLFLVRAPITYQLANRTCTVFHKPG